jgi:hypothetical protein
MARKKSAAKKSDVEATSAGDVESPVGSTLDGRTFKSAPLKAVRGSGTTAAGQSGDLQGLSRNDTVDSESVEELVEEGQFYEAEVVNAVENAPDADQGEIRTREVPGDDIPQEYLDEDEKD